MKPIEIVIVSGKGGTGKTTVTSSFCSLASENAVFCDTDVDAPDLWILMHPVTEKTIDFLGMEMAEVDPLKCDGCGKCLNFCRFDAVNITEGKAHVNLTFCEGCGGCELICPTDAITMKHFKQGEYYFSRTEHGPFWHAQLNPGGENSGLLVQILRDRALKTARELLKELIIVDGPPGIACPTISSLTGSDLAVVVTEPTMSGKHDLIRLGELCDSLNVPVAVIINKADLSEQHKLEIEDECRIKGWYLLGEIPFRKEIIDSVARTEIPLLEMKPEIESIWRKVLDVCKGIKLDI